MKIVIETNKGTFAAYLNREGKIDLYEGGDDIPVAVVLPLHKRGPMLDVSTDGVAKATTGWLEKSYDRLEIFRVTAHPLSDGR